MNKETVKGFRDYTGKDAEKKAYMRSIIESIFRIYGFNPAETPVIEYEEFVKGPESQAGDEAVSDIFKLQDKGKRDLALRYEFTFQLKRLMQNQKLPFKRYQIGEVFRDEPVSGNRLRQFTQCDVDVVGSSVKDEAEILVIVKNIFTQLGIEPIILVNNRRLLNEILESQNIPEKNRMQVLREIDKFEKIPEKEIKENLKKLGAEKLLDLLKQKEKFFNKFESYKELIALMAYCRAYGIKVLFSPTLMRGLSYYNSNIFEVKVKGIKETIAGGGSYMFNEIQCTGISFGLDRILPLLKLKDNSDKYLIVSLNKDLQAIKLAQKLRKQGKRVSMFYGKPSKALDYANSYKLNKVVFVGSKELKEKIFKIKDMDTGKEKALKI